MNIKKYLLVFCSSLILSFYFSNIAFASILIETHIESDNRGYLTLSVEDLNGSKVCIFDFNFEECRLNEECVRILKEIDHKKIEKNADELIDLISEIDNVSSGLERLVAYYQGEDVPIDDLLSETCNSLSQKKDTLIHRLFEFLLFDYFNSENNLIYFPV